MSETKQKLIAKIEKTPMAVRAMVVVTPTSPTRNHGSLLRPNDPELKERIPVQC